MLRLLRFIRPYRWSLAVVLVLAFLQSLANLYLPRLLADVVNVGVLRGDTGYILRVGGLMLAVAVTGACCALAGAFFSAKIAIGFGRIGLVPQRAVLSSGTIGDNIRYGKQDASAEDIEHAAEVAQASEFVSGLPEGFESVIAQGGINLSGGQKQRLAIARALVKRPDVYIFDDSFSALDFATDARLRAALRRETGGATVFIISQRVGTIMDADRIVVLDEGRVVGIGRHEELLAACPVYREIVESQLALQRAA
jgi:ABC-type multidrug transport system fused ATPase/permease subunit